MDTDIVRLDREFYTDVIAFLMANKLSAHTDRYGETRMLPRSLKYKRRHEAPAQFATISKAQAKRLRKMERNRQ